MNALGFFPCKITQGQQSVHLLLLRNSKIFHSISLLDKKSAFDLLRTGLWELYKNIK